MKSQTWTSYQDYKDEDLCDLCGLEVADLIINGNYTCRRCSKNVKHLDNNNTKDDDSE